MKYKGFIIRKGQLHGQYEIIVPRPLQDHLSEGWPYPNTIGVKDTLEDAKEFADQQIKQVEQTLEKLKQTKELMERFQS